MGHKEDGLTSRSFRGTGLRLLLGYWADLGKGETIVRSLVLQPQGVLLLLLKLDRLHTGFSSS